MTDAFLQPSAKLFQACGIKTFTSHVRLLDESLVMAGQTEGTLKPSLRVQIKKINK